MTTGTGWFVYYRTLLVHAFEGEFREKILLVQKVLNPFMGLIITSITVLGGGTPAELWVMADFSSALPTFINVFVLLILSGKVFDLIKDYKARYMGVGQVDPNFKVFYEE